MSSFKINDAEFLTRQLKHPHRTISAVMDTDAYNEVDDQFAIAYALLSPEAIDLKAIYAAPFHNNRSAGPEDGMEKSYDEILRLLDRLHVSPEGLVFKGSRQYLTSEDTPVDSPAAQDLVVKARAHTPQDPLYVLTIGAPTNVASALLIDPSISDKMVIVWLGGHPLDWHSAREFNLFQDIHASRVLFNCGAPLVNIPCKNVAEHLRTSIPELKENIKGHNALCDFLYETVEGYTDDPKAWSKVIWDISVVAWLVNESWVPSTLVSSPILTSEFTYSRDDGRHLIRVARDCSRDKIFRDLFAKLIKVS